MIQKGRCNITAPLLCVFTVMELLVSGKHHKVAALQVHLPGICRRLNISILILWAAGMDKDRNDFFVRALTLCFNEKVCILKE
jgi:hypothetical protein